MKWGSVLTPTLFFILFAAMLLDAFSDCDRQVYIQFRTDGRLFKLERLQAKTKVFEATLREFFFADDCALGAHSHEDVQYITDHFEAACKRFGLTISLGKTEAMLQPSPSQASNAPPHLLPLSSTALRLRLWTSSAIWVAPLPAVDHWTLR